MFQEDVVDIYDSDTGILLKKSDGYLYGYTNNSGYGYTPRKLHSVLDGQGNKIDNVFKAHIAWGTSIILKYDQTIWKHSTNSVTQLKWGDGNFITSANDISNTFKGHIFNVGEIDEDTPVKTPTKTKTETPTLFGGTWVNKATINNEKSYSYGSVRWRNDGRMFAMSTDSQFPPGASVSPISGFVRLYQYDDTNNSLSPTGNILNGYGTGDKFGAGLSINGIGNRVAVGAPTFPNNSDQTSYAGRIGVYVGGTWELVGNIINGSPSDQSGNVVDLNDEGNRLLVASSNENVNGLDSAGTVRVYDLVNNAWTQIGQTLNAEQSVEVFGGSAVISGDGNTIAIGSWQYNDGQNRNVGRVIVYNLVNNTWVQKGEQFTGQVGKRLLGEIAISHDGNIITFGNQNNSEPAIVNQYKFENSQWNKVGNDIVLPLTLFGHRLKMSADTKTIVIGYDGYNENASGNQVSGMVRVYRLSGNTWLQLGQDIKGSIVNQKLGHDLDITNDGLRLVILSRYFDESKPMEATVYYYEV
jgi:hypothetical protein